MFPKRRPRGRYPTPPRAAKQWHAMPGDICKTLRGGAKHRGAGARADTLDMFIDLACMDDKEVDRDLRDLFNLIFNNKVPERIAKYFRDSYLFCLHKDINDKSRLRPIAVPSALRRAVALHVAKTCKGRFAQRLLPQQYAVGVEGGMDFIIKTV